MRWSALAALSLAGCFASDYLVQPGDLADARARAQAQHRWVGVPAKRPDGERVRIRVDVIKSTAPTADPRWLRARTDAVRTATFIGVGTLMSGVAAIFGGSLLLGHGHWLCFGTRPDCPDAEANAGMALVITGLMTSAIGALVAIAGLFERPAEVGPYR